MKFSPPPPDTAVTPKTSSPTESVSRGHPGTQSLSKAHILPRFNYSLSPLMTSFRRHQRSESPPPAPQKKSINQPFISKRIENKIIWLIDGTHARPALILTDRQTLTDRLESRSYPVAFTLPLPLPPPPFPILA